MRRLACALSAVVLLSFAPVPAAAQLDRDQRDCQKAIATAARTFEAAKLDALVDCKLAVVKGDQCKESRRDDLIARTADRVGRSLERQCRGVTLETLGFPGGCTDANGPPFSTADLRACVLDTVEAQVDAALAIEFASSTPQSGDVAQCQSTIARRAERFLQGKLHARSRCLSLQRNGDVAQSVDCTAEVPPGTGDAKTDKSIAKLQNDLVKELDRRCSDATIATLGFPGTCPDTTGGSFTVADVATCIQTTHEAAADVILAIVFATGAVPIPTATPTPAGSPGPTESVSPSGSPAESPSPSGSVGATPTPVSSPAACVLPNPLPDQLSLVAKPGVDLDTGWTGQSHDLPGDDDGSLTTVRVSDCDVNLESPTCGQCVINGPLQFPGSNKNCRCVNLGDRDASSLDVCDPENAATCTAPESCECYYGPPLPLSSGAVPVCVVNRYTAPVTGTANVADSGSHAGEAEATIRLESAVHNGPTVDRPCPVCDGDVTPLDGVKDGTCDTGAKAGDKCDVSGVNEFFGPVSFDCPPAHAANIGNLDIRFSPATTQTTSLATAGVKCTAPGFTDLNCFCDTCATAGAEPCNSNADCPQGVECGGRRCIGGTNNGAPCTLTSECPGNGACGRTGQATAPNACEDGVCSPNLSNPTSPNDGICLAGPFDPLCSIETFRGCLADTDCNPPPTGNCGTCVPNQVCATKTRECFLDPIVRSGTPGTQMTVIAATFCIPPTTSPAVNSVAGLPGPGGVLLPALVFRGAATCGNGVVDAGEECDPPAEDTCPGACQADCTCAVACGDDVVNQPSEQCDGTDQGVCTGACQPDCTCAPVCGNGTREGTEECDMGDDSACPGVCQPDCTCGPFCGDNTVDPGEECDGTGSTACPPAACKPDCTCGPFCGNGVIDPGETCDNAATGPCAGSCAADCTCAPFCGNGIVEGGEVCDPGGIAGALPSDAGCPGECQADCRCTPVGNLSFVVTPGSDLDNGWTGQSHDAVVQAGSTIAGEIGGCDGVTDFECTFFANVGSFCSGDPSRSCTANTQCLAGQTCIISTYGPPLPLSSGGVPVCVVNRFAGDVTGTYNLQTGDSAIFVPLNSLVFFSTNVSQPCPVCDCGARTCTGGANAGASCTDASACPGGTCDVDVQQCLLGQAGTCSNSPAGSPIACTVEATGPFGPTANVCAPNPAANVSGGGLDITWDPATTGTATRTADRPCTGTSQLCWCDGEERPNACATACNGGSNDGQACTGDSECPGAPAGACQPLCRQIVGEPVGEGECPAGPADQRCAAAEEIGCTKDADCPSSTGPCLTGLRRCFLDPIVRPGTPGTTTNVFASVYCIPATTSSGINVNTGLPGPGAVRLPNQIVSTLCGNGVVESGEECDAGSDANCPGACQPDCTCGRTCGNGIVEFGETCDIGGPGGTPPPSDAACPGTCLPTCQCTAAPCGNGSIDPGETCELPAVGCGPLQQCVGCTSCQ